MVTDDNFPSKEEVPLTVSHEQLGDGSPAARRGPIMLRNEPLNAPSRLSDAE